MQSNIIQQMTASKDPVISDFANQIISEKSMADLGITGPDVAATQPAVAADYPPAIVPILAKLKASKNVDEAQLVSAELTLDQNVPAATERCSSTLTTKRTWQRSCSSSNGKILPNPPAW